VSKRSDVYKSPKYVRLFPSSFTWFSLMLDSRSHCLRQMVSILGCATMVGVRIACHANVSSREAGWL
jgi:hypothetical protein